MRPVRLVRIAAEAEGVRLRGLATRMVVRLVCAVIALVFVIAALTFGHIAAWYGLRQDLGFSFYQTTGALGGADLLIAAILGYYAARSTPSRIERDALEVRKQAIAGLGNMLSLTQLAFAALRIMASMRRPGRRAAATE